MPGMPAARLTDMHTCPLCMGVPAPITAVGAPTVLIGYLPAARMGDVCVCIPPPVPDPIVFGSPTVLIMGQPAARMLDPTGKGGVIVGPCAPNVLIGLGGTQTGTIGGMSVVIIFNADGTTETHVGNNIVIKGSPEFQAAVVTDLSKLAATPTGAGLLNSLDSGSHKVTIVETSNGNECGGYTNPGGRFKNADGTNGAGTDSTVSYNPHRSEIGDGTEAWTNRPPAIGLGHELIHADDASKGQMDTGDDDSGTRNREKQAVGLPPYENRPYTENKLRREMGQPERPRY